MAAFETVVIEPAPGGYRLTQGGQTLLTVPDSVFETFEADSVFPPTWKSLRTIHPVRRLFWNPDSRQFLMAGLEDHPARTVETRGSQPFRAFLHGVWVPSPPVLLLRPFWNPPDPYDAFDAGARKRSFAVQWGFLELLRGLRPPPGWTAILNATDPYLDALGVGAAGSAPQPGEIEELSLTPPKPLTDTRAGQALEALATEHAGNLFPVLRGDRLSGVHALSLGAVHRAEALLDGFGLAHQRGPYRPH